MPLGPCGVVSKKQSFLIVLETTRYCAERHIFLYPLNGFLIFGFEFILNIFIYENLIFGFPYQLSLVRKVICFTDGSLFEKIIWFEWRINS